MSDIQRGDERRETKDRDPVSQKYTPKTVPTPPPWRITICEVTGAIWIERRTGGTKEAVCKMGPNFSEGRDLANAELILSALAESVVLRTACQWALDDAENGGSLKTDTVLALRAALKPSGETVWKIVERDDRHAVHSQGYYGESGRQRAQQRCDSGDCLKGWLNRGAYFVVVPA